MRCGNCGVETRPGAKFCGNCGKPVANTSSPVSSITDDLDKLQQELTGQLDATLRSLDQELAGLSVRPAEVAAPDRSETIRATMPAEARPLVHQHEWAGLVRAEPEPVLQSAGFVFGSPFIQSNQLYQERAGKITFRFFDQDPTVNAFATDHPLELTDGSVVKPPAIVYFGGLGTAIRLGSAALAAHILCQGGQASTPDESGLVDAFRRMGTAVTSSGGELDVRTSEEVLSECVLPAVSADQERFVSLARSYSAAMDMVVVAHEAGHIALGHTLGKSLNYEVSRNQEREADSFASSALSTSPFEEYLFLGQLFVMIIFSWVEHAAHAREASTHPVAEERLANAIRSNPDAAKQIAQQFGLSQDALRELLPSV